LIVAIGYILPRDIEGAAKQLRGLSPRTVRVDLSGKLPNVDGIRSYRVRPARGRKRSRAGQRGA